MFGHILAILVIFKYFAPLVAQNVARELKKKWNCTPDTAPIFQIVRHCVIAPPFWYCGRGAMMQGRKQWRQCPALRIGGRERWKWVEIVVREVKVL